MSGKAFLARIQFKDETGGIVETSLEYLGQSGHILLDKVTTPEGRTHAFEYNPSSLELSAITTSSDPIIDSDDCRVSYQYAAKSFYINPFYLDRACARVVTDKTVTYGATSNHWSYIYPATGDPSHKVTVIEPRGHKREVTFQGYYGLAVWPVGNRLIDETFHFDGSSYTSLTRTETDWANVLVTSVNDPQAADNDFLRLPVVVETRNTLSSGSTAVTRYGAVSGQTALDYDRFGNNYQQEQFDYDGSLLRRTEFQYAHSDLTPDDAVMKQENFTRAITKTEVFDTSTNLVSRETHERFTGPPSTTYTEFGQLKNRRLWNDQTGGEVYSRFADYGHGALGARQLRSGRKWRASTSSRIPMWVPAVDPRRHPVAGGWDLVWPILRTDRSLQVHVDRQLHDGVSLRRRSEARSDSSPGRWRRDSHQL